MARLERGVASPSKTLGNDSLLIFALSALLQPVNLAHNEYTEMKEDPLLGAWFMSQKLILSVLFKLAWMAFRSQSPSDGLIQMLISFHLGCEAS